MTRVVIAEDKQGYDRMKQVSPGPADSNRRVAIRLRGRKIPGKI